MDPHKSGRTISFLRKKIGLTQQELADRLNVTDKAVSRWERGVGTPDLSLLLRLSAVLDTDIESILAGIIPDEDASCKGLLAMVYPEGISASTFLYTERTACFQLSLFLLAGIREICVRGREDDVHFVQTLLKDGAELGIKLCYEKSANPSAVDGSPFFVSNHETHSVMVIDGLDFLYSNDMANRLRRMIIDSNVPTVATDWKRSPLSLKVVPPRILMGESADGVGYDRFVLGRGLVTFPIQNGRDLLDAGNVMRIIEERQGERIADLGEIAKNSFLLNRQKKTQVAFHSEI